MHQSIPNLRVDQHSPEKLEITFSQYEEKLIKKNLPSMWLTILLLILYFFSEITKPTF